MKALKLGIIALTILGMVSLAIAQNKQGKVGGGGGRSGGGAGGRNSNAVGFHSEVPTHAMDVILGRPTAQAITLSLLSYSKRDVMLSYSTKTGDFSKEIPLPMLVEGQPLHYAITGLQANTRYYYQLRSRIAGAKEFTASEAHSFMTARPVGAQFVFTIQADSHLDGPTEPELYLRSLASALAAQPDFHIDLGDTFMTDKHNPYTAAAPMYLAQRYYFGQIGHSAPVFLTLGNHDGETLAKGDDSMALWSNAMRKRYFPNPEPNSFYTGNNMPYPKAGLLQNYFAWQWGDAQFIVLDPFWNTTSRGDNWTRSLGKAQYDWLTKTLENSKAKYKFVFIHHLAGGETREGRGGAEASKFFEWGGQSLDGQDEFAAKRPGWAMPVHQLLVAHKVSAVFHGHDHLYVKQERDGIIYQEVPQPGHPRASTRSAIEYGYLSGTVLSSPGMLRVKVGPDKTTVEFVQEDPKGGGAAEIADSYHIAPKP